MIDPCSTLDAELTPDLVALDARARTMRDSDPLPAGGTAVVLRFATGSLPPLALAAPVADLHRLLTPVERALAAADRPHSREVEAHIERWGTVEYRPDAPSWLNASSVDPAASPDQPVDVLADVEVGQSSDGWAITLHTATGLPFTYRATVGLVEELWVLLYERWQDLDPSAGPWI
jgi:hypothetical protein